MALAPARIGAHSHAIAFNERSPAMTFPTSPAMSDDTLDRLARRRAGMKMGWALHATVYVLVNLLLAGLSAQQGRHWAVYPAMGWGLGLLIHGAVVWLNLPGGSLHDRLLARERRLLQRRQGRG